MPRSDQIHSSEDARRIAKQRLPWMVFEYIDGAEGEKHGAKIERRDIQEISLRRSVSGYVTDADRSRTSGP